MKRLIVFIQKKFYIPQKTLYFDIPMCYNNIDILYTGDEH